MWSSPRIYSRTTPAFALYKLLVSSCCQHKNLTEIEKQLLKDFSCLYDSVVGNKLSIYFGQDKTKSILFGTKHKLRNAKALNIVYNGAKIKE